MRQKILLAVTKSVWGGAQRYVFDLATNLPKDKYEIVVLAGGEGLLVQKLRRAGIKTIVFPVLQKGSNFSSTIFSLANLLWPFWLTRFFLKERPEIIHFSSSKMIGLGGVATFFYKLLTFNFKILTVATVHGWPFRERRFWMGRVIIFLLSWFSMLFQKKIILINTDDFKIAKKFISAKKLFLILNGLGPIEFLERGQARQFLGAKIGQIFKSDDVIMGTIAELTLNKGLEYLIKAAHKIQNTKYKILIIGEGEEKNRLQKQIQSLNLGNMAFLLGFVPKASQYLKGFDIFVLSSLKEGLPYAILEAMSAGLPIVATRVGGAKDLITSGESGILVPPQNSEKLQEAVFKLAQKPEERRRLGQNAAFLSRASFSLDVMIQKTCKCYEA